MTPEPAKRATEPKPGLLFMNPSMPSRNVQAVARYASLYPVSPAYLGRYAPGFMLAPASPAVASFEPAQRIQTGCEHSSRE